MKKIAIVFSDLHLNLWAKFNDNNHRTLNGFKVLSTLSKICSKENIPALFCGDFFHKPESLDQELFKYLVEWFNKENSKHLFKLIAIEGNHDLNRVNSFDNPQKGWLSYLKGLLFNSTISIQVFENSNKYVQISKNVLVFGISYIDHNIGINEAIKNIDIPKGFKSILLLHTDYPGAKDTDDRLVDSVENLNVNLLNKFDLVLCGHIHKPQKLGKKIYMVGAPIQQRRTDRNCSMGYWELYEDLSLKFIPLDNFPKFIDVDSNDLVKDDGNYYTVLNKTEQVKVNVKHNITKKLSKKRLAHRYLKYKGIKDDNKEKLLIRILKESDIC